MAELFAADIPPAELATVVQKLVVSPETPCWIWAEAADGWVLDTWSGLSGEVCWYQAGQLPARRPVAELLPRLQSGRIFTPEGELRWRQLPVLGERCCRVVFLGRAAMLGDDPAPLARRNELAGLSPQRGDYPLWGQMTSRTPDEWIDLRIPHRLRYPVPAISPHPGRVIVYATLETWQDEQGTPHFYRLCELRAQKEI